MSNTSNMKRNILRLTLIVSLGINVAVIGGAIGLMMRVDRHFDRSPPAGPASLYVRALSHDSRRALGQSLRRGLGGSEQDVSGPSRATHRQQFEQGYNAALIVLRNNPLDSAALDQVMSNQAHLSQLRLDQARAALVRHLASMTADERRSYADRLEHLIQSRD